MAGSNHVLTINYVHALGFMDNTGAQTAVS
jgi:hypothetical protein